MPELWLVQNCADEECFNIYFSKERAELAIKTFAGNGYPAARILGRIREGEAFGEQVINRPDGYAGHEQDMFVDW